MINYEIWCKNQVIKVPQNQIYHTAFLKYFDFLQVCALYLSIESAV